MPAEFELIDAIRRRATSDPSTVLGIGDDAAVVQPRAGYQLVAATDTLVAGVHFDQHLSPADVGWKAVAVNLSDLASMGAEPRWLLLALTLPEANSKWLGCFLDGLISACSTYDVALIGGDTTRGPLAVSITALGEVPAGQALTRGGARIGDVVAVTGELGSAALALHLQQIEQEPPQGLLQALARPVPQLVAGQVLRTAATACIDISDGLVADLTHLLQASGVGARIAVDRLPRSDRVRKSSADWRWAAAGGDDYQLCFTLPADDFEATRQQLADRGCVATLIGEIIAGVGPELSLAGEPVSLSRPGFEHFDD